MSFLKRKTGFFVVIVLLLASSTLIGQTSGNSVTDVILSGFTAKMFTPVPVSDNDINLILKCGIKATSSHNNQPWKFTVVKDTSLTAAIIPKITPGNIIIIISGLESFQEADWDCGLATQNMYIAAQSLGLGAHIYTGAAKSMNSSTKQILEIPEGYKPIFVLRIGNIDKNVDAISSASKRKAIEEVVNYK
jgi:nitroreductase